MALTVPANVFDLLGEESDVSNLVSIIHDPIAVAAHKAAESKKREEVREAERKRRKEVKEAERKLEEEARKKKEEEERASMARRLENRRKWFESQEQKRIQLEEKQRRLDENQSRREEMKKMKETENEDRKKRLEEDRKLKEENPSKWEEVRKKREMKAKKEAEESIKAAFLASNRPRVSKSSVHDEFQRRGPSAYQKGQVHGGTKTQVRKTPSTLSDASDIGSVFSSSATRPSSSDQTQEVAKNGPVSSTSTSTVVSTSSDQFQESEREEAKVNGKDVDGWQQVPSRRQGSTGGDGDSSNKSFDGRRRQNMNGSALRKLKKKKAATGGEKTQGEKTQEVDSSLVQNQYTLSYTLKEYEEMKQRKDESLQNKDDVNNVVSQPRPKTVIFDVNKGFRTPEKDHRQRGFGNGGRRFNNEGPRGRRFNNGALTGRRVDERDNELQGTKKNSAGISFSLKDAEFPSLLKKA